jgi:recombination protein RecA
MSELDSILKQAQKDWGEHIGGKGLDHPTVGRIATGLFPLDMATGGCFPQGRLSIVYGPESSGKTTLCYKAIAYTQHVLKMDAVFIDIEHTFDPIWAAHCGVDTEAITILRPQTAEIAVDLVDATIRAESVGIVVLDSVGSMITDNEVESDAGKMIVGGSAQIVSKMVRKATQAFTIEAKRGHTPALLCVNQIRYKIGVMFGDPETMPGGNLIKFASSLTIRLYGKDVVVESVSKDLPTFKKITGVIKKWKVPIISKNFTLELCLIPHGSLSIGDCKSWNTVLNLLKLQGSVVKVGKSWVCMGEEFKTLAVIEKRYTEDPSYQQALQKLVVDKEIENGQSLPPQKD